MNIEMLALAILLVLISKGQGQNAQLQIVVTKNGSGRFSRIEDAILAAPNYSQEKFYILIKEGIYVENIFIGPEKTNIVLVGEGMDKTIISGSRSSGRGFQTSDTATVAVYGNGFMAQGITFENTAGPEMQQAIALSGKADNLTFYQCRFRGYQDTLNTGFGNQFFRECEIIGTIDFIFGIAAAVFQNCVILVRKPLLGQYLTITAQGRMIPEQNSGIIFQNCTISATEDLRQEESSFKSYFGRPWFNYSTVVILQSFIDTLIDPKGWIEWEGTPPIRPFFAEFNNYGPGANTSNRVTWSNVITSYVQASHFTVRSFLQMGAWIPPNIPHYLDLL